ncbi:MAG: iron dicitrate transport regulator FecR [Rhodobacteraceae bacterium]|nr:iron dicitrate transport regulator FecR [Paracoccaceae bacterium]
MESGFSSFPLAKFDELINRLQEETPRLPKQEARLAQFISLNVSSLGLETGKSLADKAGVSEVTVGRLLRRLGCDGMKGLKQLLREHYSVTTASFVSDGDIPDVYQQTHEAEVQALTSVFIQTGGQDWDIITRLVTASERIYVTGFQSVRGLVEDFHRRLALARRDVFFLSAHDDMLVEWLTPDPQEAARSCLILVDVVPYATETVRLARLAKAQGRSIVVVSDEYCHWSRDLADAAIYAPSRTGLFLESTVGIVMALSLIVDAAAAGDPEESNRRLAEWKANSKRLGIF